MNDPEYTVAIDNEGCPHCGAGLSWTVQDKEGVGIGVSWIGDEAEAEAEEHANALNHAFDRGQAAK